MSISPWKQQLDVIDISNQADLDLLKLELMLEQLYLENCVATLIMCPTQLSRVEQVFDRIIFKNGITGADFQYRFEKRTS